MATTTEWEDFYPPEMVGFVKTLEEVESAQQEMREPCVSSFLIELAESVKSSDVKVVSDPRKHDVRASTLIQFFSVSIERDTHELSDVGSSFEIYGHIKLTTDYGRELFLFKREHHDPFMLDDTSKILPKYELYCPHWLPKYFWLEMHLVDKSRNLTIVNDDFLLDFRRKVLYDKEQVIKYNSLGYGRVIVNYEIFCLAVSALVFFEVSKNGSGSKNGARGGCDVVVSGTISANTEVRGRRGTSRVLYDKQPTACTVNEVVELPALAVPVYSLLKIKVDLVVDGERIVTDDALEVNPSSVFASPHWKDIVGEGGKWRICLRVFWNHAFDYLPDEEFIGELTSYDFYEELSREQNEALFTENSQEEFSDSEESSESEDMSGGTKSCIEESKEKRILPTDYGRYLVEVFSVCIGSFGHDHRPLRVYGTIKYDDSVKDYLIFERDEMKAERVFPHKPISLLKPQCCHQNEYGCFEMQIDLKDAGGREISKGIIEWYQAKSYRWWDRRICSVVHGEHGFACVHYAIFDNAVSAKVRVRLLSVNHHPVFKVHGNIHARYSTYRCSTHYEKKYYRSMLFEKRELDSVKLCGGPFDTILFLLSSGYIVTDVPLSKDVVAVPCDTSLILEVELHVRVGGEFDETIRGELTIDPRESAMICIEKIKGKN